MSFQRDSMFDLCPLTNELNSKWIFDNRIQISCLISSLIFNEEYSNMTNDFNKSWKAAYSIYNMIPHFWSNDIHIYFLTYIKKKRKKKKIHIQFYFSKKEKRMCFLFLIKRLAITPLIDCKVQTTQNILVILV